MTIRNLNTIESFAKKGTRTFETTTKSPVGSFGDAASYIKEIITGDTELDQKVMGEVTNILGK